MYDFSIVTEFILYILRLLVTNRFNLLSEFAWMASNWPSLCWRTQYLFLPSGRWAYDSRYNIRPTIVYQHQYFISFYQLRYGNAYFHLLFLWNLSNTFCPRFMLTPWMCLATINSILNRFTCYWLALLSSLSPASSKCLNRGYQQLECPSEKREVKESAK